MKEHHPPNQNRRVVPAKAESAEWEQRVADLWTSIDELGEEEFLARMETLVAELPADSAAAAFERASALDSTGHSERAIPFYRQALERGLDDGRRRRAVIQMASSLRSIGRAAESVALLTAERDAASVNSTMRSVLSSRWLFSTRGASAKPSRSP